MQYSLTVIRLNSETNQFQNTECNSTCSLGTLLSILFGIPCDEDTYTITKICGDLELGQSKTIQLNSQKTKQMWFCYVNCIKSIY